MEIEIKINSKQNQESFSSSEKIYRFKNIHEILDKGHDYILSGEFKSSGKFSYPINDVKCLTLFKDDNSVIDIVISKALIENFSVKSEFEKNTIIVSLNHLSEFEFIEKAEGFLIILKKDYPEELRNSEFFKQK